MSEQLDLFNSVVLRDEGMSRALDHADEETPSWGLVARGYLNLYAGTHETFQAEDVRHYAEAHGFALPPDGRAWGAVVMWAVRDGTLIRVGYAKTSDPKSHANPKSVWTSWLYRGARNAPPTQGVSHGKHQESGQEAVGNEEEVWQEGLLNHGGPAFADKFGPHQGTP